MFIHMYIYITRLYIYIYVYIYTHTLQYNCMVLLSGPMAVGGEGVRLFASESYEKRLKAKALKIRTGFWRMLESSSKGVIV